jgi:hypothetical protein
MDGLISYTCRQAPPPTVLPDPISPNRTMLTAKQLSLFPDVIRSAHLLAADSPRKAFYRIWIEANAGLISVRKASGIGSKVLDRRRWPADTLDQAVKMFEKVVADKTNPNRKSPRKYRLINSAHNA